MRSGALLTVITITAASLTLLNAQEHNFSVKDDIAMARFSDPSELSTEPGGGLVQPSPDGKHYAVVTTKGLLDSDMVESDIVLFNRANILAYLSGTASSIRPRTIAQIVSYPHEVRANAYASMIEDLKWGCRGACIYFRGEDPNGIWRLYMVPLGGRGQVPLTPTTLSIDRYDVDDHGIVYRAYKPTKSSRNVHYDSLHDAEVITGTPLQEVLFPSAVVGNTIRNYTLGALNRRNGKWTRSRVPGFSTKEGTYIGFLFPFSISPNAEKLVTMTPVKAISKQWQEYTPASGYESLRFGRNDRDRISASNLMLPVQYSVVDLHTGLTIPLLNAPNARALGYLGANRAVWSHDGKRVFLTNTFLDRTAATPTTSATYPCAVLSVDLLHLNKRCLFSLTPEFMKSGQSILEIRTEEDSDLVSVLMSEPSAKRRVDTYKFEGTTWILLSSSPYAGYPDSFKRQRKSRTSPSSDFTLSVEQGLNMPPALWTLNKDTGQKREIWNPNPQLERVSFGEASVYRWKDSTGYEWTGGLIKPVGYVAGKRYPLILQMYSFDEHRFLTDGTDPTAFAARHLASDGFIVLEIQKKPTTMTEADADGSLEGYKSAIDALSAAGLIDPARVGVVGFSMSCWYVWNALIKAPRLFAAATIADGNTNSYMEYMLFGGGSYQIREQHEALRGGMPFVGGLQQWVKTAPAFHLDRVRTPVRLEAIAPLALLTEWEAYSSLQLQGKPVDLIYFPHGTHIHQRPLERLESQQGNIDWMRFWLQDYEDPDPAKKSQYLRWRQWRHSDATSHENVDSHFTESP
ncbi:hypothetical protein [Silvibacterium sp.]|uniref:hypothetical protein n=1 Tax=Silvibacterium sp. TaxID=1964179 RepID=UPI0039E6C51F